MKLMKLLLVFIQKQDSDRLLKKLGQKNITVTSINSEGGFLRKENATLFIAIPENQVDDVLSLIKQECKPRTEHIDTTFATGDVESLGLPNPTEIKVGGATVLVLEISDFVKI